MKTEPFSFQSQLRERFNRSELNENSVAENPFVQFALWLDEAKQTGIFPFPNTFSLCTVGKDNSPSSRIVLMRRQTEEGILFYTQYGSRKANDISHNPEVCANFYWPVVERQIQIAGLCSKISEAEADTGFRELSRENQLSAWASLQSEEVRHMDELEEKFNGFAKLFNAREIPRPSRWGGFLIEPHTFEFWQFRPMHFNDRIRYKQTKDRSWKIQRVAP